MTRKRLERLSSQFPDWKGKTFNNLQIIADKFAYYTMYGRIGQIAEKYEDMTNSQLKHVIEYVSDAQFKISMEVRKMKAELEKRERESKEFVIAFEQAEERFKK